MIVPVLLHIYVVVHVEVACVEVLYYGTIHSTTVHVLGLSMVPVQGTVVLHGTVRGTGSGTVHDYE